MNDNVIRNRTDIKYKLLITFISCAVYVCLCLPFRYFFELTSMTEIRIVTALPPVCSVLFGFLGALGCSS